MPFFLALKSTQGKHHCAPPLLHVAEGMESKCFLKGMIRVDACKYALTIDFTA